MSQTPSLARHFAVVLAHHAARCLPLRCAAWSEPMRREVESIESDMAALRWAVGCVVASAGGPGIFGSIGLALRGRRFQWGDYRALAATLMTELTAEPRSARNRAVLGDDAAVQTIRNAKELLDQQVSADQVGALLQSRIDSMATAQRRSVNVLRMLGRSLLWFGGIAFLLGALIALGQVSDPPVLGGMLGAASTGLTISALFAAGFAMPLANRLDAIIMMDGNFYAFIRTAFVCRAAGSDAALAVRTANGALPAELVLDEGELNSLSIERAKSA